MAIHVATADQKSWLEVAVAVVLKAATALAQGFAHSADPAEADSAYWAFDPTGQFGA